MGLPGKPFTNKIGTMIDDDINGRVEELETELAALRAEMESERAKCASLLDVCKKIALEESSFRRESYILDLCNVLDEF